MPKKTKVVRLLTLWLPAWFSLLMAGLVSFGVLLVVLFAYTQIKDRLAKERVDYSGQISAIEAELLALKNEDQFKRNDKLQEEIKAIEKTYAASLTVYELLLDLRALTNKTQAFDDKFSKSLTLLSKRDYTEAEKVLGELKTAIEAEQQKIAAAFTIPATVPTNNTAPAVGYSRQKVTLDIGEYLVDLVAGDLSSTKVIVDTASESTCANNCPVLPLGDYVTRNGAYAGINGSYFCPASYPTCAEKTNSFDTLLMNKNKVYFNSDNNVHSLVPAVIFGGSYVRFIGRSADWGRDTGIDSMIANQPLLVSGGNVVFGGDGDPKKGSKGPRSFVANKGNTVYIGVVHNATVAESARVLQALGMDNGLNLDSGGSTALWSGGYKVGPGRNIPNVILFIRR